MNLKTFIILFFLTLTGGFLRFYGLTQNPISLNTDEVTFAYSAYSTLTTGKDEYGNFLPITFRSVGDYKNPVSIYLLVPSIAIFGLNEFGARAPFVLMGILAIPLFYFLVKLLTADTKLALVTAGFTAISPWHIFYSRFGHDGPMAMVVATLGLVFFLAMIKRKKIIWATAAAFFLVLSMYTYYSERAFIPLLVLLLGFSYFKFIKKNLKLTIIFLTTLLILVSPLAIRSLIGSDLARGAMVFIGLDIDYKRYIILDQSNILLNTPALLFFAAKRYLNYFQPDFLFFNGLNMTHEGSLGVGLLYLFELPFLLLGIWSIGKRKGINKLLIFGWIFLSILPASLTNNEQNPSRVIIALPMVMLFLAAGFLKLLKLTHKIKKTKRIGFYFIYGSVGVVLLIHALLVYIVHWPLDRGEFSFEGNKEAVQYAIDNQYKYDEIVFDQFRGVRAPEIYALFDYYLLFYSKYDPKKYQIEVNDNIDGFGKYRFRKIYWPDDRGKTGTLFIGSPWSLPLKDIKEEEILKRIYLKNGDLALLVVTPLVNPAGK